MCHLNLEIALLFFKGLSVSHSVLHREGSRRSRNFLYLQYVDVYKNYETFPGLVKLAVSSGAVSSGLLYC